EQKQRVIRLELDRLVDAAKGAHARLMARAMDEAPDRSVKDLRALVRRWVEAENRKHADPTNPNAGMRKRKLVIGNQNADGTVDADITFTAGHAALFKTLTDKGLVPNSNLPEGEEDYRTPAQRRYDQFIAILEHFEHCQKPAGGGCASVLVSCTLDQLADAGATTKFATNTGIDVTAFDLVRLGMDGTAEFVLAVDDAEHLSLDLYRTRRTASIAQRVTLLALQGVCAWAGCTAPLSECEAHHVVSWLKGGNTDIGNLAALCRQHHRMNNDNMDHRGNSSHVDICPTSRRVGLKEPGSPHLKFNTADAAEHAAVNLIRTRESHRHHTTHLPPERPPDPPPPREPVQAPPWAKGQDPYPPF
ncbi:HNH endonuclease signature motif containing protein, partial [Corynebacterium jeddahense]